MQDDPSDVVDFGVEMDTHVQPKAILHRGKQFKGFWSDRTEHLFSCGVDFKGKTVLDVGCNMGIVGYEVCKAGATYYHGVDILPEHLSVAHAIFSAIETPHRIEIVDVTKGAGLAPIYDIVLYLAVDQHIEKAKGKAVAVQVMQRLLSLTNNFIYRGPNPDRVKRLGSELGYDVLQQYRGGVLHPLVSLSR